MILRYKFIFILVILLVSESTTFQSDSINSIDQSRVIIKENNTYLYYNEIYEYIELGSVFIDNSEAKKYYNMSFLKEKRGEQAGLLAAVSNAFTLVFYLADKQGKGRGGYYKFGNIGIVTMGITLIALPISLEQHSSKRRYEKMSIGSYN